MAMAAHGHPAMVGVGRSVAWSVGRRVRRSNPKLMVLLVSEEEVAAVVVVVSKEEEEDRGRWTSF